MDLFSHPETVPLWIIAVLVSLTVHEWAHAFTAWKLGDDTARYAGRLTLNPVAHLDPLGAVLFLVAGFGWAKPVPVDARNFRHPVRDSAIVAAAGPLSNLVLAFAVIVVGQFVTVDLTGDPGTAWYATRMLGWFLVAMANVNLALMAFNLLPIPPLDGSNIVRLFIPWRMRERYDELFAYGPWIIVVLLVAESFVGVSIISGWVGFVTQAVKHAAWAILG